MELLPDTPYNRECLFYDATVIPRELFPWCHVCYGCRSYPKCFVCGCETELKENPSVRSFFKAVK